MSEKGGRAGFFTAHRGTDDADGPYAPHVVTADKTDGERAESEKKGASLKFRKSLIPPSTLLHRMQRGFRNGAGYVVLLS